MKKYIKSNLKKVLFILLLGICFISCNDYESTYLVTKCPCKVVSVTLKLDSIYEVSVLGRYKSDRNVLRGFSFYTTYPYKIGDTLK